MGRPAPGRSFERSPSTEHVDDRDPPMSFGNCRDRRFHLQVRPAPTRGVWPHWSWCWCRRIWSWMPGWPSTSSVPRRRWRPSGHRCFRRPAARRARRDCCVTLPDGSDRESVATYEDLGMSRSSSSTLCPTGEECRWTSTAASGKPGGVHMHLAVPDRCSRYRLKTSATDSGLICRRMGLGGDGRRRGDAQALDLAAAAARRSGSPAALPGGYWIRLSMPSRCQSPVTWPTGLSTRERPGTQSRHWCADHLLGLFRGEIPRRKNPHHHPARIRALIGRCLESDSFPS